jgi:phosphate acetyltransferase
MERKHEKYQRLLDFCKSLPPTPTAVAHPCDESSLRGAVEAARLGLIAPILVGPRTRIETLAKQNGIDLGGLPIVDAPYSEASAAKAVDLVREGRAEALMKGSLHTDELMGAVVKRETGLRTARRISLLRDGRPPPGDLSSPTRPSTSRRAGGQIIIQNAIDLAHAALPRSAWRSLSAMETSPKAVDHRGGYALCKIMTAA